MYKNEKEIDTFIIKKYLLFFHFIDWEKYMGRYQIKNEHIYILSNNYIFKFLWFNINPGLPKNESVFGSVFLLPFNT